MLKRKIIGFILLILVLVFSAKPFTGAVISQNNNFSFFNFMFTLFLLLISLALINSRISLDAILIPCSNDEGVTREKARIATREHHENPNAVIVASGGKTPGLNPAYDSEADIAYEELIKAGIQPGYVRMERRARDTFDNIRYSLEQLPQDCKKVGVVANRKQLKRIERIVEAGKKEGKIEQDFQVIEIESPLRWKDWVYEFPAGLLTSYSLRKRGFSGNLPEGRFKKWVNGLFYRRGEKKD